MKKNIWVEKLGALDLAALFIETLFFQASVRYDENKVSGIAARLIDILQRRGLCKNFYIAKLTLGKVDAAGYALQYRMENDLDSCLNRFCDNYMKNESVRLKSVARLYITTYLTYRSTFVTMVESEVEFKDTGIANTLYLRRNPINSVIIPYYREKGYAVRESISLSECLAQYLKPCYRLLSIIAAKLSSGMVKTSIVKPRPSIWVEYAHGAETHYPFWREGIDEKMFDIVCYLDRNDNFSFDEQIKEIEKKRLKWIDLHFCSLVKLSEIGVRELIDMWRAFFSCPSGLPFWFRIFRFEFRMWYLLYKPVFRRYEVKALLQHQDALWIKEPQLAALEDAGGIMVGFHWSNIPFYKLAFWSNPQHVYFVWGKMMYEWIEKKGNICHHVLPAGLWLGLPKEDVGTVCLKDGLKFVMAIFDSSVAYNICQSEGTLAEFYLRVLSMLEKNPEWGGIVKSKCWSQVNGLESLPRGNEIVSRANCLIKEKRLIFLSRNVSPVIAAMHADLSVCYGLNSAGIISSIYGHRAVHWDCTGWLNNPFYKDKDQKFIFATLDGLEDAVVKASQGDTTIGDFSAWKQKINHFNDESGGRRVGKFINDFMVGVANTNDAVSSLERAVKRYCELNNVDDSFFNSDNIWEDEKIGKI